MFRRVSGSTDYGPRIDPTRNPNGSGSLNAFFDPAAFHVPGFGPGFGSRNYILMPHNHSNDINVAKLWPIGEKRNFELRVSLFNPFNMVRRDSLNTGATFKAKGARLEDGFTLFNSRDQLVKNLLERRPNATALEQYNQDRPGFGHVNLLKGEGPGFEDNIAAAVVFHFVVRGRCSRGIRSARCAHRPVSH